MPRLALLAFLSIAFFSITTAVTDQELEFYESEQELFVSGDINDDGKLSKDEFRALLIREYKENAQANGEDNEELIKSLGDDADISELDIDGDGVLSDVETIRALTRFLDETGELDETWKFLNTDGNEFITWTEFYSPDEMDSEYEEEF
mmetsp:Transcript_49212/g.59658  ORF Transcript_49212/g.59658 Transcript_49212/m.59658 type:complete len:149 (+) Transcript_49212:72-518(+)|eukprot:CAMPEP_0172500140 /NCGR_PEP_ID=MMETSP1066-20121228/135063_1 /TAXON_ID=671091 /ORGANISM="Coscinodiscus wailesii, Strain CCMP2513" /LENGTH=148 /DNA_ID=CAMNT_0013274227 /DNA_START=66 /DNA_END=512 /DNA_ORIENTATION=+